MLDEISDVIITEETCVTTQVVDTGKPDEQVSAPEVQNVEEPKDIKIVTNEGTSTFYVNGALLKAKAPKLYNTVTNKVGKENFSKLKINPTLFALIIDYINGAKTERDLIVELNRKPSNNAVECTIELLILAIQLTISTEESLLATEIISFVTRNPASMNPIRTLMIINYCEEFLIANADSPNHVDSDVHDRCKAIIGNILTKAWNFFRYFSVDCLNNASSADIMKVTSATLAKIINIRWMNVSEDSLYLFISKWVELHLMSASEQERDSLMANVDMYRLTGPMIVGPAKRWIESKSTSEHDLYVTVLERTLLRDSLPLPPPLRVHGFFAIGPSKAKNPIKGFKVVSQETLKRFFNLLVIQIRNDGGVIPLLELFPVFSNVVTVDGVVPIAVPNPIYGTTNERLTVKRVLFAEESMKRDDTEGEEEGNDDPMKQIAGWAAVNFGDRDITECISIKAEDWTFTILDEQLQKNSYALYIVDDILPL